MFFFAVAIFLPCLWFLPWWSLFVSAFILGIFSRARSGMSVAVAGGVAWTTLAYIRDGQNFGIISERMAGLLSLPSSLLIFVLLTVLGGVSAGLGFQSGRCIQSQVRPEGFLR